MKFNMDEKEEKAKEVESKKVEEKKEPKKEEKKEEVKKPEFKKVETKKPETKKETKKKETKSSKKAWYTTAGIVAIILIIVAILTVMIVTSSDPKKSVDGFLTNIKEGDFEKAQEFISGEDIVNNSEFSEETQKLLFDKLAWKVTKITKEENKATVEIEITNKDFKTVISNYMQKALKAALSGETQQEIENYFTQELKSETVQTTTNTKTINLVKEDKKWKVVSDDTLSEALLPGLQEAVDLIG